MITPQVPEDKAPEAPAPGEKKPSMWRSLLLFVLAAWFLRSFVVASFSIPSGSMQPTMHIGDYLFVSKWPYGYSKASMTFGIPPFPGRIFASAPETGDIVVFIGPQGNDVVKRVIGRPGDTIAVADGVLSINGKPVERQQVEDVAATVEPNTPCRRIIMNRPFIDGSVGEGQSCRYRAYRETLPNGVSYVSYDQTDGGDGDNFGPVTVPEGHIFLMGDNRDDSLDSRFAAPRGMGLVPIENIVGRAEFIFWSTDGSANWLNPISWFTALRTERIGTGFRS